MTHNAPCFGLNALDSAYGIATCSLCRATFSLFGLVLFSCPRYGRGDRKVYRKSKTVFAKESQRFFATQ